MIKGLIENECAGQNSLIKLASLFTNTNEQKDAIRSLRTLEASSGQNQLTSEHFVNEYLSLEQQTQRSKWSQHQPVGVAAPRTFQMETLFNEIKHIEPSLSQSESKQGNVKQLADWSQDPTWTSFTAAFQKQPPLLQDERSYKWSTDYLLQNETKILDEA